MTDPFLAEVRIFGGNFAPTGWALCNGQLMSISQNTALFSLLGTTYGGDGRVTFALPNLMGSVPLQQGQGRGLSVRYLGDVGGASAVTLQSSEMPAHTHQVLAVDAPGDVTSPTGAAFAQARNGRVADRIYSTNAANLSLNPGATPLVGGGQPHNNMPPFLGVTFIIALQGIFPQRP
jgi:microcystin-dependent protein